VTHVIWRHKEETLDLIPERAVSEVWLLWENNQTLITVHNATSHATFKHTQAHDTHAGLLRYLQTDTRTWHTRVCYDTRLMLRKQRRRCLPHNTHITTANLHHNTHHFEHRQLSLKPRLHDTTCCQTGCQTGLTTRWTAGCIVYTNIQPFVQPVVQPSKLNPTLHYTKHPLNTSHTS